MVTWCFSSACLKICTALSLSVFVEDGVEHEHAAGEPVRYRLDCPDGEPLLHAADEGIARNGAAEVAANFDLFYRVGELDAPLEHHLEDNILIGAVGLHPI